MPTINPADLQKTVMEFLDEYGEEVIEANESAIRDVAKATTKELRKSGSFGGTGKYRRGITMEIQKNRIGVEAVVGAAGRNAGLTHLLEFGHAKQNGGRTTAFNFVKPVNDRVEEKYMEKMEELLR